jgi:hypothetical protein
VEDANAQTAMQDISEPEQAVRRSGEELVVA